MYPKMENYHCRFEGVKGSIETASRRSPQSRPASKVQLIGFSRSSFLDAYEDPRHSVGIHWRHTGHHETGSLLENLRYAGNIIRRKGNMSEALI